MSLWKLQYEQSSQTLTITLEKKWELKSMVKGICLLSDQGHVCVGTFDGTTFMWNIKVIITLLLLLLHVINV